jgi:hypothetical protein
MTNVAKIKAGQAKINAAREAGAADLTLSLQYFDAAMILQALNAQADRSPLQHAETLRAIARNVALAMEASNSARKG